MGWVGGAFRRPSRRGTGLAVGLVVFLGFEEEGPRVSPPLSVSDSSSGWGEVKVMGKMSTEGIWKE